MPRTLSSTASGAQAIDPLDKAWRKGSDRPDIGFHLSQALGAAGRKNEARALLRRLLAGHDAFAQRAQAQDLLRQLGG
jgi:thioredoxin-like negative regulator of GroEL